MSSYMEQVPDSIKLAASGAAPTLAFIGISIENWGYVLSAIVSIMFIIEKFPVVVTRLRQFRDWVKRKYASRK